MKLPFLLSRDRLARRFARTVETSRPLHPEAAGWMGKMNGNRFLIYTKKRGLFALYPCVLRGKIDEKNRLLRIRFTRPLISTVLLAAWLLLSLAAGLSVLFEETVLAPVFLLPVLLFAPSLFLFSKKDKAALLSLLERLMGEEDEKK